MKHKKYHTDHNSCKSIRKIIDLDSHNKHVHDSLSVLGAGTTIKGGGVKIMYVPKPDLPMNIS